MSVPTPEQCSATERVTLEDGRSGLAFWWPQMGGYVAKAVILRDAGLTPNAEECCLDVLVWHDGEFPFNGHCPECRAVRNPVEIHICDTSQWLVLARLLATVQRGEGPGVRKPLANGYEIANWGVFFHADGGVVTYGPEPRDEECARAVAAIYKQKTQVVRQSVTYGPWIAAPEEKEEADGDG